MERKKIDRYIWGAPNGQKASIMLEEMGLPYSLCSINSMKGEQHAPDDLAINPNGKIPALVDRDVENGLAVFESGAILVYLAEKADKLLPSGTDHAKEYIVGEYSIAAIANYTWASGGLKFLNGQHPDIEARLPHLKQWIDHISSCPTVMAGRQMPKLN